MSKTAIFFIADGCEPLELIAPVDALRRGGVNVVLASVMGRKDVLTAQNVNLVCDSLIEESDLSSADIIVLPGGGEGVENLGKCEALIDELRARLGKESCCHSGPECAHNADSVPEHKCMVGAICAAPAILADNKLLDGRRAVCYPGCQTNFPPGVYQEGLEVCRDGNLITATGPGTALKFGIALLRALEGETIADQVASGMLA